MNRHPYLSIGFWQRKENQFWNTEAYSEKSKKELNEWADKLYLLTAKQEFEKRIVKC